MEPERTCLVSGTLLALDRCLAFDTSRRGPHAVFRFERTHGLPSVTPQRMGWLQGLAGPTAANLWPSTSFSFWKLTRNVWCGDRDLGRKRQAQNKACCGTVSPRTELMQLDGAVLLLQASHASLWPLLVFFPLPKALSVPVEKGAPGCLAAGTESVAVPSLAGQTCWMITQSCTAAFETLCSATGDGVPKVLPCLLKRVQCNGWNCPSWARGRMRV